MKNGIVGLFLLSTVLAVCILSPYSLKLQNTLPNAVDPLFYAWNLSHNADNWFKGFDALVNTNIFYPLTNTLAYSDTLWGQSLFINPIIWISHNPVLAENIAIFMTFPLSALSMFLLSMYFTDNVAASFCAGLFFAFSYPRLAQIGHLPTISSEWLPLYLLYVFKFLRDGRARDFILICIWYLLSITSSIYFGVFLIPVTAVILAVDFTRRVVNHSLGEYKTRFITLLPILIPFVILMGIVLFPYIRLKIENPEIKRSIDDLTHLRASPADYISVLPTSLLTFTHINQNVNEHVLFPTITVTLLALSGMYYMAKKNRFAVWTFLTIGLISFILSLGNEYSFSIGSFSSGTIKLPYYYLYMYVPVFQIVRVPARFGIFVVLSLSLLAALGIKSILESTKQKWIIVLVLCLFLTEVWQSHMPYVSIPLGGSIPKVYQWIAREPERMILAEVPVSLFYHGISMEEQLYKPYGSLRQPDTYELETYRVYYSAYHKKRMINGYSGFLPDSYNKLAENLESFPADNTIRTLRDIGVTDVVVHLWQYDDKKKTDIISLLNASSHLSLVYTDGQDRVYAIQKKGY